MKFPFAKLLEWFQQNQRALPWRKKYQPYEIWVSEIMLQQTRVEQMIPYFEKFLKKFSSIEKLAQAKEQTVLKAWEGLGYYSRARNMHAAAKQIVSKNSGKIPKTAEELKQLPGFGEYISNAVASIAFNEPVAVVDGNVFRVLSRFFGIRLNIAETKTKKEFQLLANQILPKKKAREFNQAVMELGALVCLPQQPLCSQCPLQEKCFARKNNLQDFFPVKTKKKKKPVKTVASFLVQQQEKTWLIQRKQRLLQGLWELPQIPFNPLTDSKKELEKKMGKAFGVRVSIGSELAKIGHDYTHFHQTIFLFQASVQKNEKIGWIEKKELKKIPLSKANQKLLEKASKNAF